MSPEAHRPNSSPIREDFTDQPGLFDYTFRMSGDTNPLVPLADLDLPVLSEGPQSKQTVAEYWLHMLESDTPLHDVFYLLGIEDPAEQAEKVADLLDHAADADIGVGAGETLGDLQTSDAPDLYEQFFRPRLRPKETPRGDPFPYTSIEDAQKRTDRLREIKGKLSLHPDVVVNMGSGYDVTPSDAFPDARVVHVDIDQGTVEFLRRAGFEAYQPHQVPKDLAADLIIDVFGPGQGNVPLAPGGSFLTTQDYVPEHMKVTCIVPSTRFEILPAVTDPAIMREIAKGLVDTHLRVLTEA
jgi:hypothetical protein